MSFLGPLELARVIGMRPAAVQSLQLLMQAFEDRTGVTTFVPEDGGLRTAARQQELLDERDAAGEDYPVASVDQARHVLGGAFDLHITGQTANDARTDAANPYYQILAEEARKLGLVAGIGFGNPDPYHFELNETLANAQAAWAAYQKKKGPSWWSAVSQLSRR